MPAPNPYCAGVNPSSAFMALAAKLIPGGKWDAMAFVDECEAAVATNAKDRIQLLREIQRIESEAALEYFLEH